MTTATTQATRSRISRERILDAAVQCLVEDGYSGASTLRIQQLAGVSRGRLLHHFGSRDELLVGAVHHLAAERVAAFANDVARTVRAEPDDPARIDQAVAAMWSSFHQPYSWASVELWVAARHSADLRAALGPTERALNRTIRGVLDLLFGPVLSTRPRFREVTDILLSSMRGASLTYAFGSRRPARDPHLAMWTATARTLLLE